MNGRLLGMLAALIAPLVASADPGHPVAVRWWGQGMVSIETYWNLQIVIDPHRAKIGYADPQIPADLVLVSHNHFDHNNVEIVGGQPEVVRGLDSDGRAQPVRGVLDRLPNQPRATWLTEDPDEVSGHQVTVQTIPAWHDNSGGADNGATALFAIDADGVRIVHCGDLGQDQLTEDQLSALGRVDVLLLPTGGDHAIGGRVAADIVRQVQPHTVIPITYKTPALLIELEPVDTFLAALGEDAEVERANGNTLAVSAMFRPSKQRVVVLGFQPWKPPEDLRQLLDAKDKAAQASESVFAPLSAAQMNFRPSDGTHTPRWNAEHMMGREMLFFTKALAQRDLAFVLHDLNPAQMPPDYEAAHPDWTGAEEARQIERVRSTVRRFAYIFGDESLDAAAWHDGDDRRQNAGWTFRFLLKRMADHYNEHTANVRLKFEAADWPKR